VGLEVKAIHKKGALSRIVDTLEDKLQKTVVDEAKLVQKDFQGTSENWKTKVTFEIREIAPGPGARIFTTNLTYVGVSEGTPPHDIYAKPGKRLFFMTPYGPKTKPGSLTSGAGSIGNTLGVAMMVHHPGTKPRDFNTQIKDKARPRFVKRVRTLVKNASGS
jgi:hypothetical protein